MSRGGLGRSQESARERPFHLDVFLRYNNKMQILKKYWLPLTLSLLIMILTGVIEYFTGRSLLGPSGTFGFWESSIWSSENSQRVADVYSFSHIIHGMGFYALLWLFARRVPMKYRFVLALLMEAVWELFENSPIIINRYRSVTLALGYVGDSVLNSVADIVMVGIGFIITRFSKVWLTVFLVIAMELGCLFWVRDNLTLNILMLVAPIQSVLDWQNEIRPQI